LRAGNGAALGQAGIVQEARDLQDGLIVVEQQQGV
jgi:hypothetical protein